MPWHSVYHPELRIIETRYHGDLNAAELGAATDELLLLHRQHGTDRLLSDCTGLRQGPSTGELYAFASTLISRGFPPTLREALLMPARGASVSDVRFWETVCGNRGLQVRILPDRASAIAWLQEP